jgi:hypothetical protein
MIHNMFPFKRKVTSFTGGDCPRSAFDLAGRHDHNDAEPRVEIVKCQNEDEDLWLVCGPHGNFSAYGHDLHPHPEAHETNVEAVTRLMENGSTAFVQAFIMEGAIRYAEQVLKDEAATREQMAGGFITADLMIDTAKEVRKFLKDHLKPEPHREH